MSLLSSYAWLPRTGSHRDLSCTQFFPQSHFYLIKMVLVFIFIYLFMCLPQDLVATCGI